MPQDHPEIALFLEDADAESRNIAEGKAKVRSPALAHLLNVILGSDAAHQLLCVLRLQGRTVHAVQDAVQADDRRHVHPQVQVGRAFRNHQLQQVGH